MAGSVLLTLAASRLADQVFHWWFRVVINPEGLELALFYVGTVALVGATATPTAGMNASNGTRRRGDMADS